MTSVEDLLANIEGLLERVRVQEAEDRLRSLLYTIGRDELSLWEYDIRRTIDQFLPKRRKALLAELRKRSNNPESNAALQEVSSATVVRSLQDDFERQLEDLSARHIFQWSTFYRETLLDFYNRFSAAASDKALLEAVGSGIYSALTTHARDIFRKGFQHVGAAAPPQYAITKSLSGLQRFLELPVEFYSAKIPTAGSPDFSRTLRVLTSAFLTGILNGYADVSFGTQTGSEVLPRFPRSWAHYLAFLIPRHLEEIVKRLEPGDFRDGVRRSVLPLVEALETLVAAGGDYVPLPVLGQLVWESRRLDVGLKPPPHSETGQLLEVQSYLDAAFVSRVAIYEALNRNVSLVIAPLRPDLHGVLAADTRLNEILVGAGDADGPHSVERRAVNVLEYAIYRRRSVRAGAQPLTYNFAREFPLHNPHLTRYFHVYRSSVRELLRTFERRNGVRLWCSVRRSGKTTACFDLSTTTGTAVIVSQTCGTARLPDSNLFYEEVSDAIESGRPIPKSFLIDLVARCASGKTALSDRFVFILDEYETLFGRLKTSVRRTPDVRYTVVQPLLNQMVGFAAENLLVFLGQQPNAHFILMDQNQLSPYVEQDSFPLFQRGPDIGTDEFAALVRKVLTERVELKQSFLDALYSETAGHPFLTVKVLVAMLDWLIEGRRPLRDLKLSAHDFEGFHRSKLNTRELSLSPEYVFFREAISEATGTFGRTSDPWLYCVYSIMREIALASPDSLTCSMSDVDSIAARLDVTSLGFTADYLLGTAAQANFLRVTGDNVQPKIRILGRLAGVTRGKVSA